MVRLTLIFIVFCFNLLWDFIRFSEANDDNIFMVTSSKFFLHPDVNSYFGYSLSSYIGQNKAFCLVGAPRDVIDDEFKENDSNVGAVYSISIDNEDCSNVPMGSTEIIGASGYSKWLGGSVSAAVNGIDGVQLGCDPRFLSKTSYGINKTEQQLLGIGQCSLYTGASLESITIQPCSSIDEGACLSGFSSSVLADDQGVIKVALGLPGSFLTEGNVFLGSYRGKDLIDKVQLKTSPLDLKNRGFNLGYAVQVSKLWYEKEKKSPFINSISNDVVVTSSTLWKSNEYRGVVLVLDSKLDMSQIVYIHDMYGHLGANFGSCVATGDFNGDGILDIAVGSPFYTELLSSSKRIVDIGAVYVFYGQVSSNFRYLVSENNDLLKGTKEKGNFGMSLASLGDIDGDGKYDLAVGCPNCGEDATGSVFIFLGGTVKPAQIITPRHLNHSPVIPVCNNLEDRPILRPFQNFGWSLTGQFDLDRNQVPDLIIGDYSSAQIVYLRSKNIVWLDNQRWILPTTRSIEWTDPVKSNLPCAGDTCRYYISLKADVFGRRMSSGNKLTFRVDVDLDSAIKIEGLKRIQFVSTRRSISSQKVDFNFSTFNNTIELLSAIIEPRFDPIRSNIWQPLVINVSVSYSGQPDGIDKGSNLPWMLHPFKGAKFLVSPQKRFKNSDCGDDNDCVSDVRVSISDLTLLGMNNTDIFYQEKYQERRVVIRIGNWGENAFNVKLTITIPSVLEFQGLVGLNCSISMSKDGVNVIATCHFGDPFPNSQNSPQKLYLTLNTGGAFRVYKRKRVTTDDNMALAIKVECSSDNKDKDLSNNFGAVTYFLRLAGAVQVTAKTLETTSIDSRNFSIKVSEFQRVYPETLGPPYKSMFVIKNDGPSPLELVNITISIPFKTQNGENLLYFLRRINQQDSLGNPMTISQLPEVISVKGPVHGQCQIPSSLIDPYNLNTIERNPKYFDRRKRSTENTGDSTIAASQLLKIRTRNQEIINCSNGESVFGRIKCVRIECTIFNLTLQSEVHVVVRARIWAETFFQYKVSDSVIHSTIFGSISPQSYGFNVSGNLAVAPVNISHNIIFKGIEDLIIGHIPIWPIVLGVLLGLLFLTIIIFLLWKCGFFQRHRQFKAEIIDDTNAYNNGYSSRYNNSYTTAHL